MWLRLLLHFSTFTTARNIFLLIFFSFPDWSMSSVLSVNIIVYIVTRMILDRMNWVRTLRRQDNFIPTHYKGNFRQRNLRKSNLPVKIFLCRKRHQMESHKIYELWNITVTACEKNFFALDNLADSVSLPVVRRNYITFSATPNLSTLLSIDPHSPTEKVNLISSSAQVYSQIHIVQWLRKAVRTQHKPKSS